MAEEASGPPEEEGAESPEGGGPSRIALIVVVLFGLAGGGIVGMPTIGPVVGRVLAERSLNPASGGGHGAEEGPSPIHLIDNLVVNPARSGGTRFLLTTIAVEVMDASMTEGVAQHDVELRDALIIVLGAKTTDELADISLRPMLVRELGAAIAAIVGPGIVHRVYIPQFVIQ